MSNEIKMSDVFGVGEISNYAEIICKVGEEDICTMKSEIQAEYASHAINTHDQHVARIAELKEALIRVVNIAGSRSRLPEYVQDIYHIAQGVLEQSK